MENGKLFHLENHLLLLMNYGIMFFDYNQEAIH